MLVKKWVCTPSKVVLISIGGIGGSYICGLFWLLIGQEKNNFMYGFGYEVALKESPSTFHAIARNMTSDYSKFEQMKVHIFKEMKKRPFTIVPQKFQENYPITC